MELEKAIEILTLHYKGHKTERDPDFFNACYLGIEALKRIERQRPDLEPCERKLLPGETKE